MFQRNGAPTGYGQQYGDSIFLDREGEGADDFQARLDAEEQARLDEHNRQQQAAAQQVRNAYQALLGREAESDEAVMSHLGGGRNVDQQGIDNAISSIRNSPEAQERARAQAALAASSDATSNTMPTDGRPTSASPAPSGDKYTGFQAKHDFSAFDTAREQDPKKSAKDAFAMLSNQAPPPPFHSKSELPSWFNQHVRPGFESLGHKVLSVDGDGFTYTNHEGTFHVDFAQNAGASPGSMLQRLQWNATPADDATRARYPQAQAAAPPSQQQAAQRALAQGGGNGSWSLRDTAAGGQLTPSIIQALLNGDDSQIDELLKFLMSENNY